MSILKAVGHVRTMAAQAAALQEVVAVLDQIGPLEQAVSEAQLRLAAARKEADDAATDLIAAKARVKKASEEANKIAEGAANEAERVVAAANAQAKDVLAAADAKAAEVRAEAQEIAGSANASLTAAQGKLATLDDEIAAKQKALAQIEASIGKLRAKLGD